MPGPQEWFDICVAAGKDPKELRKLALMDLYVAAGKVIRENAEKQCKALSQEEIDRILEQRPQEVSAAAARQKDFAAAVGCLDAKG